MGAASSSGKIGGEDYSWLLGTDSAAGFAEESGGGSSSAAPPSLARPPAPSGDSSWLLEMEEPSAPESGGKSDSAWVLGMGEDGSRPPATLGRVLESKRMRREAVTARDQAEAAIMEIEEMNDLDAKEKAVADLMRSLGQGETVDRMQRQGIKIDTGLIRQFLPKENRSKPLLYREFGEQANRLDGGPEPKQLPASERAAVGDAIERFNLTGGMTKKPTEATKAEARASDREVLKTLDDLARENAAREAERIVESSPIGDMAADVSVKMGIKPQENGEQEITPRERFDARRLLKTAVPSGLRNNSTSADWDMRPPEQPEPGGVALSASEAERIVAGEPDATFLGTAKESALDLKNQAVVGSVVRIQDAIAFHQAANRLQDMSNYPLREQDPRYIQDRQTVVSKQNEELLESYRSKKGGIPYIAGNVAGQMPGFLAEMVMTGGAYVKAGNAVRRMVLGELAEQSFKQVAQRSVRRAVAAEGAKWAEGSLAQATAMPWRYAAGTAERMQPKATHFDESGQLVVDEAGDGFGKALVKAYADNAIEVASEHAGEAIEWVLRSPFRLARAAMPAARRGRLAGKVLEKTRWTRRELADLTNIAKGGGSSADMATFRAALRQLPDGRFAGSADLMPIKLKQVVAKAAEKAAEGAAGRKGGRAFMKAMSERAGFQPLGEYGEELLGDTARVAAGINDSDKSRLEQLKDVWAPGWEQFIGVNLGFAPMGLVSLGGEGMASLKSRHDFVREKAERLEAWKKANGESGSQTGRKWLDRYALADSPAEWRQVEQDELAEARDSFAENASRAGASKEAVAAVRAAETWKELESAWEQARREGIGMLGQAMAADVREKGLGEDLAKRFENAKTEEEFNAAREARFTAIRNGHADDLAKAGHKDQSERVRQAKDEAAYNAALKQNWTEDVAAAADEMESKGYLPEETAEVRNAQSRLDFAEKIDSARFMRQRRELADTVAKAPDGAERAEAIRGIETGDTEALEQQRFEAFRDFAMPEIMETAGFSRELAEKAGRAKNHDELSMLLAEAIGKEIAAPASGLPSYIAEAVAAGDAQLAVYFGALRRMRMEQWKEAITANVSKWVAAVPEGDALLDSLAAAKTEAEVADLAEQAEAMRQQARKMGLAGAAAAVATDATGAEDAAARIVEEMASGGLTAVEAVRQVAGPTSGIPGIPADPMPPIQENPVWKALSRPDSSAVARKIFDAEGDSGEKLAMIAAERARLGLPDLSLTASAAFHDAMEAGILTPRMVLDAIRLRETARKPVGEAKKKAETPPEEFPEAELRGEQAETAEARAERRAAEIVSSGAEAEATIAAIDRERVRAGFEPLGASERGAAVRDIREGVFTAERAAGLILGRKPQAPAEPAKPKRRGLFGIPVSKRRTGGETAPETGRPQGDRIDMTTPQGGMKVKGRLVVVDLLKGMRSSYQDGYNQKWQNRLGTEGKTLEDKEDRVDKIKREFDAREMMPEGKTMTDTGPMWIEPKSRDILSGNGRYKALWQLHREGRLQGYIERVRAEAAARGIDIPADVEVPAFAIEIDDGYDFDKFVDFSNRRRVSGYNAYETAIKDANVILRENLLDLFAPGDDGDVVNEQNRPFWTAFIRAVGAESDLYDTDGNPIVDQLDPRIRRAVLAALLKDKPNGQKLVQALVERANQMKAKAQVTAIMAAAGPVLQVENEKPGLSIANEFAEAVEMFLDFKPNEGAGLRKKFDLARAVEKYLATPQLFKRRPGAIEKTLFRILVNSPGATAIRERFKAYVQLAAQVDTTSGDLFGGGSAAANAASDRAEKIRMLEQALGVQVEAEDAAKPKVRKRGAMRPVSERKKTISEPRRTVLPRRPTVTLATEAANRLGLPGGDGSTFHFVEDVADLPADVRAVLEKDANFGTSSKAFTMPDGSVYVLVNRHRDMADVLQSILHEDLESAMMPLMESPEFLGRLDQAFEAAGLTAAYGEELRNIVLQYDYVQDKAVRNAVRHRKAGWEDALAAHLQKNTEARREVMRELLAHVRQRRAANVQDVQAKGMWEAILEAIRDFLSSAFGVNFTHADMQKNVPAIESLIDEIASGRPQAKADADGGTRMRNEADSEYTNVIEYEKKNGNILNADMAKLLFVNEGYNPASVKSVVQFHKPAVALVNRLFNRWLKSKKSAGDGTVTFLGGGNGAGKSTVADAFSKSDFVFDSTMVSIEALRSKIQAVIDNGEIPKLVFVHRNPADAWMAISYRAETGGHNVPKNVFLRTHSLARNSFLSLADEFDGKVIVEAVENSTDGPIRRMSILELRALPGYGQEQVSKEIEHAEQRSENESREGDGKRTGELESGQRSIQESPGTEEASGDEESGSGQVARFRNEESLETEARLRENRTDEKVSAHLRSKGVRETPEAVKAVQLELEGILQALPDAVSGERRDDDAGRSHPDRKNAAALKKRERARLFMKQLAALAKGGETISPEEMKALFDEQPNFSAIVSEFYSGTPVAWPIKGVKIQRPEDIAALAIPLRSPYQESVKVAYLDAKHRVIDARVVTLGILNASLLNPKVVFGVLPEGTQSIVISHNHPSGDPTPSAEDIKTTRQLREAAKNLGIAVDDHVITNGTRYVSLRETGLMEFDPPSKKVNVPKGMKQIEKAAPAWAPSTAAWEAVSLGEGLAGMKDPAHVDRIAGWLRQADPDAAYLFMLNQKYKVIGVSRIRMDGMEYGNPNLGRTVAAAAMQYPEAAGVILDLPRMPDGFETQPSLLVDRIKIAIDEVGYQLLDVVHHGVSVSDGKPGYESLREAGKATFRNEEDPALSAAVGEGSAIENARREEARLAGKGMAEKENVQLAMKRYTRIIGKLWPARGKSLGVEDAQKLLRLELKRIKKIPSRDRKEVEWQIDGLANKEGSELRTAVFDVLKELDSMEGFDPSISEAAFELFADEENAAAVLEIMGIDGDAEALQEAAQKLRWAAPIWRKGVKAGWTQAERDGLYVFFLNRQKMARRAAGKFGVDNRLLMDWRAVLDGMEAVRTAAKDETRVNRALRALKAVLGADGMERMSGLVDRDPVAALRATASAVRALVFEAHAGKILDALGGNMLLAPRDVSYFLHNLDAPNLEDMAFPRIHYSVREDVRGLLGEMPWQDVFALKALEHARKRAEELGGEYDGMKAERIEAVRAKYRKKILAWLETKEPIELMSLTTRLHGLIQESTLGQVYVKAGLAKEMRGNAEAIDREVREAMPEIKGQEHVRARSMPFFERKGGMRSFLPRTDIFNANAENTVLMLAAGDMESRAYKVWFSDIHEARDRAGKAFMRVWQAMDRWYRDNGITEKMRENWRGDVKEWTFTLQPDEADAEAVVLKMNLTEAELMDMAAHLQDDETLVDVARGARIGPVRLKTTSSGTRLPARSMAYAFRRAVMESLTDVQRKVVNRMVDATTGMAPQINAMSRLLEGRDVAYSARFWSRRRDMGDADPDLPPGMRRQPGRGGLASSASSKERTSNIRGLYVKDIFDHFDEQIKWAANYAHFAMAQKMAKSALSYRMDQRARNEGEEDVTLDMRDTLSRRIGENNVDGLEFTIDRLANERRLDENWEDGFNFKRVGERIARWDAVKTLGFRVTSILNNLWGGSILLAGEMGRIGAGGAAAYWAARTRVMSPTSLKNDEIRAVKEAILEDYYFWNRIVYNRSGVQSQVIFEGAYDRAHKKMRSRVEKFRSFSLSGMSLEELHNATAAVLALMKWKGWTVDQAIRWTQFATERTQNPSSALEETNSYVFFKRHGMSILAKYWGQISVEANLLRRDFILTRGAVHKANLAAEKAAAAEKMAKAARRKMDKSGQTAFEQEAERFRAEEKEWRDKAGERARDTMRTAASIAASSFYSAAQSSILYYISRGVLPPLSKFLSRAMLHWVQDFIGRFFPELSELFQDQIVAMYQVVERLRKGQDISRTGWDRVSLMGVDSVRRLLWSVDEMRKGDVVDGAIAVFGEAGIVGGLPTGGIAQMLQVFRGIQKGTTEGWETDVRKPVSKRKKGKK